MITGFIKTLVIACCIIYIVSNIIQFTIVILASFLEFLAKRKIKRENHLQKEKNHYLQIAKRINRKDCFVDIPPPDEVKVVGLLANRWDKKYPNSHLYPWEHEFIDEEQFDEKVSSLGEDIHFEDIEENNKQLPYKNNNNV